MLSWSSRWNHLGTNPSWYRHRHVRRGQDMPIKHALQMVQYIGRYIGTTEDAKEGPKAFAEKRTPNFQTK